MLGKNARLGMLLAVLVTLAGCSKQSGINLHPYTDKGATPESFRICTGNGCTYRTKVGFSEKEWKKIRSSFKSKTKSPEAERKQIAKALARMESYSNAASGLPPDERQSMTFVTNPGQMDCIDETVNTNLYLNFLQDEGLFKFHEVAPPVHNGYFIDGAYPHNSAAVREIESGEMYVMDTYYFDNGEEPVVVPLADWPQAWKDDPRYDPAKDRNLRHQYRSQESSSTQ